jgi:DNA-binding transcriptional regulator YiaG
MKSGLKLTDEEIDVLLGVTPQADEAFGSDEDVAMLFAAHGEPRGNFETFEKRKLDFKEYTDLEDKIKILREKSPKMTADAIAKKLNVDVKVVNEYLTNAGKGVGGVIGKLPKFEIRYSYEKRPDVDGPEVLPTTRPFCKKLLALDKLYTREDIQKISQYLGYDVMRRAGGFWNNNGTVEYHCRHEFFSQIVIKKKAS